MDVGGKTAVADVIERCADGKVTKDEGEPLVLWDVELGAAHNAMAALSCAESLHAAGALLRRPLRLVSFENDLDALRLALLNLRHFTPARRRLPRRARPWRRRAGGVDHRIRGQAEGPSGAAARRELARHLGAELGAAEGPWRRASARTHSSWGWRPAAPMPR
jgi:hypothetical protein